MIDMTLILAGVVGVGLALTFGVGASVTGLERQRLLYPAALAVIAATYDFFSVIGAGGQALGVETVFWALFAGIAFVGFRLTPWLLVAGLALHGVFDLIHPYVVTNPGVPSWWPEFCSSYDVAAAAYLAWRVLAQTRPEAGWRISDK